MQTILIFGVNGQDGSYLAELCLERGNRVVGVIRRSSSNTQSRINSFIYKENFILEEGDITDTTSVSEIIRRYKPDEIYNTAAQSHVATSFSQPSYTFNVNCIGVLNILEAIRLISPGSKFIQSSTSEMFGDNISCDFDIRGCCVRYDGELAKAKGIYTERFGVNVSFPENNSEGIFQDELTPFNPQSPYAIAKAAAFNLVKLYRKSYGLFVANAIMFNHESPRRGEQFVTRKITKWIGQYKRSVRPHNPNSNFKKSYVDMDLHNFIYPFPMLEGDRGFPKLKLGNISTYRDWGHARDSCRAEMMILSHSKPDDFVVSTGKTNSVEDFLHEAFRVAQLGDWRHYVVIDKSLFRPSEVPYLLGRSDKIRGELGWGPEIDFRGLVKEMVEHDIQTA